MSGIRVSVVLACYNGAWCLERALDSLLAQTVAPDEILLCDDGSTDDSVERATAYGDAITVMRLPHRGLTPTRRDGLAAARGNWLAIMDVDDSWLPHKLERQLEFLERHPDVRWISTDGALVSAEGVLRESWLSDYFAPVGDLSGDLFPLLIERCFPLVSSSMIQADVYREVGGIDPGIPYSQDYELWLKLAARYPGGLVGEPLIHYFSSPAQLSRRLEERYRDDLELMERVARGDYRKDPRIQSQAARRASALQFDLGVTCLRSGRVREGRLRLMRAAMAPGPLARRALAACGAVAPTWSLGRLMHSPWVKGAVRRNRREPVHLSAGTQGGGPE